MAVTTATKLIKNQNHRINLLSSGLRPRAKGKGGGGGCQRSILDFASHRHPDKFSMSFCQSLWARLGSKTGLLAPDLNEVPRFHAQISRQLLA